MSEHQYYEFLAIDRPLTAADQAALRNISSRAQITSTSFSNTYNWGDLKGDPVKMVEQWFDMHVYQANFYVRRLIIRFPRRLVRQEQIAGFLSETDFATLHAKGEHLVFDISREGEGMDDDDGDGDGTGWLASLAGLRSAVLGGDYRMFYLVWLMAVQDDLIAEDAPEPMAGLGPLTAAMEALADFFCIDADLVAAAAERNADNVPGSASPKDLQQMLEAMPAAAKDALLARVVEGDPFVAMELRAAAAARLAGSHHAPSAPLRNVGSLRARALELEGIREQASAEKQAAEKKRTDALADKARRERVDALFRRGEAVWREIEGEIAVRNAQGYDRAAKLLEAMRMLAEEKGTLADFSKRLAAIHERHARKGQFIARIARLT